MIVFVQMPVGLEAVRRAVIAERLRSLRSDANYALQGGLTVGVDAADCSSPGNCAAKPPVAQLVNSIR